MSYKTDPLFYQTRHLSLPNRASNKASVEEVSMKWMDRPTVTEMERGGVYEMEIEKLLHPYL